MMPYRGNFSVWNVESYSGSSATCTLVSDSSVTAVFNIKSDVLEIFDQLPFLRGATVLVDESERVVDSILDVSAFCSPTYGRIVQYRRFRFDDVGWNLALCDDSLSFCIPLAFLYDGCYEGIFNPSEIRAVVGPAGDVAHDALQIYYDYNFFFVEDYAREIALVAALYPPFGDDPDTLALRYLVTMITDGPNVYRKTLHLRTHWHDCHDPPHWFGLHFEWDGQMYYCTVGYHCWVWIAGFMHRRGYEECCQIVGFEVDHVYTLDAYPITTVDHDPGMYFSWIAPRPVKVFANHPRLIPDTVCNVMAFWYGFWEVRSNDETCYRNLAFIKLGEWVSDTNKHINPYI